MDGEVTNHEILEFLQEHMVTREEHEELRSDLENAKSELRSEIQRAKFDFLDKMDDKLADLKGDLVILMRKEDRKLTALVDVLRKKEFLTQSEAMSVLALEPFPQP